MGVSAERGERSAAQLISCSVIPSELDDSVCLLMIVKRHRSVLKVGVKLDLGGLGRRSIFNFSTLPKADDFGVILTRQIQPRRDELNA